jgi:hypothetical protein
VNNNYKKQYYENFKFNLTGNQKEKSNNGKLHKHKKNSMG